MSFMIEWNVNPILFELGPLTIRWYGLLFMCGFLIGYQIIYKICKQEGKPPEVLDNLLMYLILGTTIGARLGHCLFYNPEFYLSNPIEIFKIWEGGLASHGGTVGVILALYLFSRKYPDFTFFWLLDRISIPTALTASFIRIGNLMNSEIVGKPTHSDWGFIFKHVDNLPRHPAQIYESLTYFCVFLLTFGLYRRYKSTPPEGLIVGTLITIVFATRIFWETFKENQEAFEANMLLNMGQILSIPFVFIGVYLIVRALKKPLPQDEEKPYKKNKKAKLKN